MNKRELLKELKELYGILENMRDSILKDYDDIDYYVDSIESLNERLKTNLTILTKYPESLLKSAFKSFIEDYFEGNTRDAIDYIDSFIDDIDEIHEHLADELYYRDYIIKFDKIEEMLDSEFREKLKELYDKIEQLTDDPNWLKLFSGYRNAWFRLDRSVRQVIRKTDDFLVGHFLKHE